MIHIALNLYEKKRKCLNTKVFFNNITFSKNPTIFKKNNNSMMATKKAMYDNRGNEKQKNITAILHNIATVTRIKKV